MQVIKSNNHIFPLVIVLLGIVSFPFMFSLDYVVKSTKDDFVIYSTSLWVYPAMSIIGVIMVISSIFFLKKNNCLASLNGASKYSCIQIWVVLLFGIYLSFFIFRENYTVILDPSSIYIEEENIDVMFDEIYSIEISQYKVRGSYRIEIKINLFSGKDKFIRAGTVLQRALPDFKSFAKNAGVKINEQAL